MVVEIVVPPLGESLPDAVVGRWLKQTGDRVESGEAVVSLETDKVDLDVYSEQGGVLTETLHEAGETVVVGEVLAKIDTTGAPAETTAQAPAEGPVAPSAPSTPLARSIAEKEALDIGQVPGTGQGGRVTGSDVQTYLERSATPAPQPPAPTPVPQPAPSLPHAPRAPIPTVQPVAGPAGRTEQRSKMSRRRQTIAARLVDAQHTAAMLTTFNEVDMSAIIAIRAARKESFKERHGVGLGFMSFFTKAVISGLKAFPLLNAEIQGDEIVTKSYYDLGIAVSTDEGLVVPVLRDADKRTFAEIEAGVADLAGRARSGALTLPELQGGTFTITNGGVFGSLLSTPILNAPQVGILGMHKIQDRPIAVSGAVVIRPMMYVALSYDHRIVDGAEAVRFLVHVKEMLEDPAALLIEG